MGMEQTDNNHHRSDIDDMFDDIANVNAGAIAYDESLWFDGAELTTQAIIDNWDKLEGETAAEKTFAAFMNECVDLWVWHGRS